MRLLAPTELHQILDERGLLARESWPAAAPDHGGTGPDLVIAGAAGVEADVVPVPCVLNALSGAIATWWSRDGHLSGASLSIGGGPHDGYVELEGDELLSPDTVLGALRHLHPGVTGEWGYLDPPAPHAPPVVEWRFTGWALRFGAPHDSGRIEVAIPRPATRARRPPVAMRSLPERLERFEKRAGALLVHLAYPRWSSSRPAGLLESPLRLPKTLEVDLVSAATPAAS